MVDNNSIVCQECFDNEATMQNSDGIYLCSDCYTTTPAVKKRPGTKLVKEFPEGEICVSMIEFKGDIFVATNKHMYTMIEKKLHKLEIVMENQ